MPEVLPLEPKDALGKRSQRRRALEDLILKYASNPEVATGCLNYYANFVQNKGDETFAKTLRWLSTKRNKIPIGYINSVTGTNQRFKIYGIGRNHWERMNDTHCGAAGRMPNFEPFSIYKTLEKLIPVESHMGMNWNPILTDGMLVLKGCDFILFRSFRLWLGYLSAALKIVGEI
jgi:hypothetical protein